VPYGSDPERRVAVRALRAWLDAAGIETGPLFRRIYKSGKVGDEGLSEGSVNDILKNRAAEAGVSLRKLTSHSMRRGMATSSYKAGANFMDIKKQGGWKSVKTVVGYIEEAKLFSENVGNVLLGEKAEK
jgi:integrase